MKGNNSVKEAIKNYLDKRAATDELFAKAYAKPNKNIDQCFDFIVSEVSKRGTQVYMSDEEVFGLAVHYYDEDNIKIDKSKVRVRAGYAQPSVELTEADKNAAREAALKAYEQECLEKFRADTAKRAKQKASAKTDDYPSLFNFDD